MGQRYDRHQIEQDHGMSSVFTFGTFSNANVLIKHVHNCPHENKNTERVKIHELGVWSNSIKETYIVKASCN